MAVSSSQPLSIAAVGIGDLKGCAIALITAFLIQVKLEGVLHPAQPPSASLLRQYGYWDRPQ